MPSPTPSDHVLLAVELLAAITRLAPTVSVDDLAAALGWPDGQQARVVAGLLKAGILDIRRDPVREGSSRLALSKVARGRIWPNRMRRRRRRSQ